MTLDDYKAKEVVIKYKDTFVTCESSEKRRKGKKALVGGIKNIQKRWDTQHACELLFVVMGFIMHLHHWLKAMMVISPNEGARELFLLLSMVLTKKGRRNLSMFGERLHWDYEAWWRGNKGNSLWRSLYMCLGSCYFIMDYWQCLSLLIIDG